MKRYTSNITFSFRDELDGTIVFHIKISAKTIGELIDELDSHLISISDSITRTFHDTLTDEEIQNKIKYFKSKKWGDKRIKNHFAKFGIDIEAKQMKEKQLDLGI